jgi:hypothetical protein
LNGLELVDVKNGALDVADAFAANNNSIAISYVADNAVSTSDELFTLVAKPGNN